MNTTTQVYRYQSAAEVRKAIKTHFANDPLSCRVSVKSVNFSDLARGSMFFVSLNWSARPGEWAPVLPVAFKQAIYRQVEALFPKGSGVKVEA